MRALVRFVGSVLLVSGMLLIADAAATVTWQEPVSALLAARQQSALADDLRSAPAASPAASADDLRTRAALARRRAGEGDAIGRISLPSVGKDFVMVEGTSGASLRKGPGHYRKTSFPGEPGTFAVAGHRTTYLAPFRSLDRLRAGDPIVAEMPYGRFTYRVERTRIVSPSETEVLRDGRVERIVLTACHPLYSAAQRIVVFGRLVRAQPS